MGDTTALAGGLLPLWPFQTAAQVRAWQANRQAAGSDPQHRLDPSATALEFTRGALGFTGVDRVTSSVALPSGEQLVGVGWKTESGDELTVATLRLVPFGEGAQVPWVVTGTVDSTAFTRPGYGATVRSPFDVGGVITGVDEALRVIVTGPGGRTLAAVGPIGAGGVGQPWGTTLDLAAAPSGSLLTLAVSTGGHVGDVEWFAVIGVRLG